MPANITGLTAGITPHSQAILRQPIGSDPPNAATFAECFARSADYIQYLMTNAGDLNVGQTWAGLQTFTQGISAGAVNCESWLYLPLSDNIAWTTGRTRTYIIGAGDFHLQSGGIEVPDFGSDPPTPATIGHQDVSGTCHGYATAHLPSRSEVLGISIYMQNTGAGAGTFSFQAGYRGAPSTGPLSWTWVTRGESGNGGRYVNGSVSGGYNGVFYYDGRPGISCPENGNLELSLRMTNPADGVCRISLIAITYRQNYLRPAT